MPQNFNPIYTLTPNVGFAKIPTFNSSSKSNGSGSIGTDLILAFTAGSSGSFIQTIRFNATAEAVGVPTVATTLRAFISRQNIGITTTSSAYLLGEVGAPAISASNITNAGYYFDIPVNRAFPSGSYVLVSQHQPQLLNGYWQATVFGGDY